MTDKLIRMSEEDARLVEKFAVPGFFDRYSEGITTEEARTLRHYEYGEPEAYEAYRKIDLFLLPDPSQEGSDG